MSSFSVDWNSFPFLIKEKVVSVAPWELLLRLQDFEEDLVHSTCGIPSPAAYIDVPYDNTEQFRHTNPLMLRVQGGGNVPLEDYIPYMKHFQPRNIEVSWVRLTLPQLEYLCDFWPTKMTFIEVMLEPQNLRLADIAHLFARTKELRLRFENLFIDITDVQELIQQLARFPCTEQKIIKLKSRNVQHHQLDELNTEEVEIKIDNNNSLHFI